MNKKLHILGGGTLQHLRNHLALCAPAYGETARKLEIFFSEHPDCKLDIKLHLTKLADHSSSIETNEDIEDLVDSIIADTSSKIIVFNVAMLDFRGSFLDDVENVDLPLGKNSARLRSSRSYDLRMYPNQKVISKIREKRKDIFLVGFKTTCGKTEQEQFASGLNLLKRASCNLVLTNDTLTRMNFIITPEEAGYCATKDRFKVLRELVDMTLKRSHLTFTRSTVVAGDDIPWESSLVPPSLRKVVDYCIEQGAYKQFNGATVGHFAVKLDETTFLTSKRKTNFNDLKKVGLVKVKTDGPDSVIAYGSRPSVGGQSQRIVFTEHPEHDCIVHFHCPIKIGNGPFSEHIPIISQREFECGSHECGKNTSNGLKKFGNLSAVYLDQHGPNIVFNRNIDPAEVIQFIERNFDLAKKSGGYELPL